MIEVNAASIASMPNEEYRAYHIKLRKAVQQAEQNLKHVISIKRFANTTTQDLIRSCEESIKERQTELKTILDAINRTKATETRQHWFQKAKAIERRIGKSKVAFACRDFLQLCDQENLTTMELRVSKMTDTQYSMYLEDLFAIRDGFIEEVRIIDSIQKSDYNVRIKRLYDVLLLLTARLESYHHILSSDDALHAAHDALHEAQTDFLVVRKLRSAKNAINFLLGN